MLKNGLKNQQNGPVNQFIMASTYQRKVDNYYHGNLAYGNVEVITEDDGPFHFHQLFP